MSCRKYINCKYKQCMVRALYNYDAHTIGVISLYLSKKNNQYFNIYKEPIDDQFVQKLTRWKRDCAMNKKRLTCTLRLFYNKLNYDTNYDFNMTGNAYNLLDQRCTYHYSFIGF